MMLRKQPTHTPEFSIEQGNPHCCFKNPHSLQMLEKCYFFPQTKSKEGVSFLAGTHPFCLFLPEKVQEEIGRTVKAGSWATYEDRKNMPYTNAVLHEVQRFITLLPHVPRCTAVDTHFRGYFLPKVGVCSLQECKTLPRFASATGEWFLQWELQDRVQNHPQEFLY